MIYFTPARFRSRSVIVSSILILLVLSSCVEKVVLPEDLNSSDFSAGDTSYLQLNPVWDTAYGLQTPLEISLAPDGRLYVADSMAASIAVFEQSGNRLTAGFEALTSLADTIGYIHPTDVDVDAKMNVLFIDGSNRIFRWNQYWNAVGIDSVLIQADFKNLTTNQITTVDYNSTWWLVYLTDANYAVVDYVWSDNQGLIDSLLQPHVFYDGNSIYNLALDPYGGNARFTALSAVTDESNYLVMADTVRDRIMAAAYIRNTYILLSTGEYVWAHAGLFGGNFTSKGTGAGFANNPTGLDIDYNNNICYSQTGSFFSIHKISYQGAGLYQSEYQPYSDEIMDLNRFTRPADVAVDADLMIYVSNTGAREIQVFNSDGSFFKKAGVDEYKVEIDDYDPAINSGTIVDSSEYFYTIEEKGILSAPAGLTVDDRGVIYVCDPQNSSIIRFRLSNELDEDIQIY